MNEDSLRNCQNDSLLNSTFLNILDQQLANVVKLYQINWDCVHTLELGKLTDKLTKVIQQKKDNRVTKIMNFTTPGTHWSDILIKTGLPFQREPQKHLNVSVIIARNQDI